MILEYLVSVNDLPQIESIGNDAELIKTKLTDDMFIIRYVITPDSEETAQKLSDINGKIHRIHDISKPVVLANESSDYYNSILYRIESQFESKLRKVLKAAYTLKQLDDRKRYDFIQGLEKISLDGLYKKLLIPDRANTIERLNEKNWKVSYEEFEKIVKDGEHVLLWDELFPDQTPCFKTKFRNIKDTRNHIMHFHTISREEFEKAEHIILEVNRELDDIIQDLANGNLAFDESFFSSMQAIEKEMHMNSDTYFVDDSYDKWLADD